MKAMFASKLRICPVCLFALSFLVFGYIRRADAQGSLRPYQRIALEAFEADRAAGRRLTHLVAPPGSGKTVVGLEIVCRLERPALWLARTAVVAGQWRDKLVLFTDDPGPYLASDGPPPRLDLSGDVPDR